MLAQTDTLTIVRSQASALIRAEVHAGSQREQLERAVREAVMVLGASVDDVSNASGLPPADVRRILNRVPDLEASALAGIT